jgi:N utilization substance protein A
MNSELMVALRQLEREREVTQEEIQSIIEDALTKAFQAESEGLQSVSVECDMESGAVGIYQVLEAVEHVENPSLEIPLEEAKKLDPDIEPGDLVQRPIPLETFRRIGIQSVKRHITERVREMERNLYLDRYERKVGEIVTGTVSRITNNGVVITLEKIDGLMPNTERIPGEKYMLGKRIKISLLEVNYETRDPQIVLSRSHPDFVRQLFHIEVPEIAQNVVQIKQIVREAGYRTKMAVISTQDKVDPVGACVGYKGSRVKNIVNELNGEKIDIIHWDENPAQFIAHALSPAQVVSVEIFDDNSAEVIVPDNQLSLAIGKQGQNARLANKLTGWRIDILSETEKERLMSELRVEQLKAGPIEGLGLSTRPENLLKEHGIETVADMVEKSAEEILEIPGFGGKSFEELVRKLDARNLSLRGGQSAEGVQEETRMQETPLQFESRIVAPEPDADQDEPSGEESETQDADIPDESAAGDTAEPEPDDAGDEGDEEDAPQATADESDEEE